MTCVLICLVCNELEGDPQLNIKILFIAVQPKELGAGFSIP